MMRPSRPKVIRFILGNDQKAASSNPGAAVPFEGASHPEKRRGIMKTLLITAALGAVLVAPALAQQAPQTQTRQGWGSKVHVYAPDYYAPQRGNSNTNPDFQLTRER
jgi:hypothetical protein